MGFKISWVGIKGLSKSEALSALKATDTGVIDEANEAPFSGAEIPGGWLILFVNDFEFVRGEVLASLSSNCDLVACQVHEGVMVSAAYAYSQGAEQWSLVHNSQNGLRDLVVLGSPPPIFERVRERLTGEQDANGGDSSDVDYFFDIPVETAAALCGYRHDRWKFDWGEPKFTVLNVR